MITVESLKQICPRAKIGILQGVVTNLSLLAKYDISNNRRVAYFLAQLAHESDGFHTTREYASGEAYEGRADLGNVEDGDGVRFRGRGLIQLTGRANYTSTGDKLSVDLINMPELVEHFPLALEVSCLFWKSRGCNELADNAAFESITRRINGGLNGLGSRRAYLNSFNSLLLSEGINTKEVTKKEEPIEESE